MTRRHLNPGERRIIEQDHRLRELESIALPWRYETSPLRGDQPPVVPEVSTGARSCGVEPAAPAVA